MGPINQQSGEKKYDKMNKGKKRLDLLLCFQKRPIFSATILEGNVQTMPLPTMQPRYSGPRLAHKNIAIIIHN